MGFEALLGTFLAGAAETAGAVAPEAIAAGAAEGGLAAGAGAGAELAGGAAAADAGAAATAGLAGGDAFAAGSAADLAAATGAGAAGDVAGGTAADLAGTAAAGGAAPGAAAAPVSAAAAGGGGVIAPTEALSGATGPLSSLDSGSSFDALWGDRIAGAAGGIPTDTGALTPTAVPTESIAPPIGGGTASAAPSSSPFAGATGFSATDLGTGNVVNSGTFGADGSVTTAGGTTAGGATPGDALGVTGGTPSSATSALAQPGGGSLDSLAYNTPAAATGQPGGPLSLTAPTAPGVAGAAGGTAAAPGSVGGTLSSILSNPGVKAASLLAPIGALGYTLAKGQPSLPPAAEQALAGVGPAQNLANTDLANAASGTITPAQAAQIAQYKQNATNQLYQFYASQGRNPNQDTDFLQGKAQIDANAVAQEQQFIDSMITQGLNAQGVVNGELNSAAQMQVASDQAYQQSIAAALQSFGLVAAISAR